MRCFSRNSGFTLVQVIFIIVVLGMLGAFMVTMFRVQSQTTTLSHQGIRAYYAAKSGLEWGTNQTLSDNNCSDVDNQSWEIGNFEVEIGCTNQTYKEGSETVNWFRLKSSANSSANQESPDYVSRTLTMQIVNSTDATD